MIIFANNAWQTQSDKPNENWLTNYPNLEQPLYVVDDKSELAQKIMITAQFNVVTDDDGQIVDIEPIEQPNAKLIERADEIKSRLAEIDSLEIRPIGAIVVGNGTDEDKNKLEELETEKVELRNELSEIEQQGLRFDLKSEKGGE